MKITQPKNDGILTWSPTFAAEANTKLTAAQSFVDVTCIRLMTPYTPMVQGDLIQAAKRGTVIGSGEIYYLSPAARYLYYGKLMVSSVTGSPFASKGEEKVLTDIDLNYSTAEHPLAGKMWFERMKDDRIEEIKAGAARILGGKV